MGYYWSQSAATKPHKFGAWQRLNRLLHDVVAAEHIDVATYMQFLNLLFCLDG